eukprot:7381962-Prymnesium_polylepis.1
MTGQKTSFQGVLIRRAVRCYAHPERRPQDEPRGAQSLRLSTDSRRERVQSPESLPPRDDVNCVMCQKYPGSGALAGMRGCDNVYFITASEVPRAVFWHT